MEKGGKGYEFGVEGKDKKLKSNSHQVSRAVKRFNLVIHSFIQIQDLVDLGESNI